MLFKLPFVPLEDENDTLEYAVEKAEEKSDDQIGRVEGVCPWKDWQGRRPDAPRVQQKPGTLTRQH